MRLGEHEAVELDGIDTQLLDLLQDDCRTPLVRLGEQVGLSAPSVLERIKKLEAAGIITGWHATLDARRLGLDVTAFIGVIAGSSSIVPVEQAVTEMSDVLECHHVTGEYTLLLKAKTANTSTLERLISRIRSLDGVTRTETLVVLSTHVERAQVPLRPRASEPGNGGGRRGKRPANTQLRRA